MTTFWTKPPVRGNARFVQSETDLIFRLSEVEA